MRKKFFLLLSLVIATVTAMKADAPAGIIVGDGELELAFRQSRASAIITSETEKRTFTATTNIEADIKIYVGSELIGEGTQAKSLKSTYTFTEQGDYDVKAVATANGTTLEKHIYLAYVQDSQPASDSTVPPMGLTKNADNTYTFCFAAPLKNSVMLVGSWNNYGVSNQNVMSYVDVVEDGNTLRYFKITKSASELGNEFGYYYLVDASITVGDPYARLVLDPSNDKYISADVYPNLPPYPDGLPTNTVVSWYSDNLLNYNWTVNNFTGASKDNLVIYELLFRDFTGTEGAARGNGTVRQAIEKIPYLKSLGINAIELLPINEFNGNISWGYNPNFYFAIDKAYGTPQDYKEFIDKCHAEGMAVILDVVFNQCDWLHPWYKMYNAGSNPFINASAPHAYSVLNDWNQGYPLVARQWDDMLQFWLTEYKVDGFRFDLVKGLGNNDSYANSGDYATNAYNASRVARMKRLHDAMRQVNPDAYFINENLAGAKEENEMAADGELNWANVNDAGCQYAMGYSSNASLNRMWAKYDSRTIGSTVAYLESHDEQRLAYKQDQWGVTGVKGNNKTSMQRLGSCAAQMIIVPGSHMIWMFSEMGNAQNTKDNTGGNNTSPKVVNWALLDDPDNAGLVQNYKELIHLRLEHTELFAPEADFKMNLSGWNQGRYIISKAGNKELYAVMNPNVTGNVTVSIDFTSNNNSAYHIVSKSLDSNPSFDAAAKTVTVEPNCYVVLTTTNVSGVEEVAFDSIMDACRIFVSDGNICVVNNAAPVYVYTLDGVCAAREQGDASITVAPGTYIVRAGDRTAKVIVR